MKQKTGVCDSYCHGCAYYFDFGQCGYKMCEYMIQTGKRRPCPAGSGCTVRKKRKYTGKLRAAGMQKAEQPKQLVEEQAEPDKLDLDIAESHKAGFGVNYGAWKATQPIQEIQKEEAEQLPICQYCGQPYTPTSNRPQKYCGHLCQKKAWYEVRNERARVKRAMLRNQKKKGDYYG